MAVFVFFLAVILANIFLYKKHQEWYQVMILCFLVSFIFSIFFQILVFFFQGHLDPFFLIAFIIQVVSSFALGVCVHFVFRSVL